MTRCNPSNSLPCCRGTHDLDQSPATPPAATTQIRNAAHESAAFPDGTRECGVVLPCGENAGLDLRIVSRRSRRTLNARGVAAQALRAAREGGRLARARDTRAVAARFCRLDIRSVAAA